MMELVLVLVDRDRLTGVGPGKVRHAAFEIGRGSASLVQTSQEFQVDNSKRVCLLANYSMTVLRFCPVPYKKRSN